MLTLATTICAVVLAGAGCSSPHAHDSFKNNSRDLNARELQPASPIQVVAADWHADAVADWHADDADSPEPQKKKKKGKDESSSGDGPSEKAPKDGGAADGQASATSTWSLVLGTFTGDGHAEAAARMVANLRTIAPQAAQGARVHTTAKGSMVVFGKYTGREDPAAVADEQRLKNVEYQGRKVFNRIMLTRLDLRLTQGQLHPHDLLSARKAHPKVDPLYTLDVAIWLANEDPKASSKDRVMYADAKKKAEAHAATLRSQGFEAYFYHDDANKRSIVTVGLFDRTAINSTSGLYSSAVTDLVKKFPARLANGEPAYEFVNKYRPKEGTKPQTPVLVLVPTM